jgi:hypothetical protein
MKAVAIRIYNRIKIVPNFLWRFLTGGPRRTMAWMVLVGIMLSLGTVAAIQAQHPGKNGSCAMPGEFLCWETLIWLLCRMAQLMDKHAPWLLVSGLASAPPLLLLWYWRDAHKRKDIDNATERMITERFTQAVEQLGSEQMAVRLGAIYALERISKDSVKDHWTIVETLAAYIREKAPWNADKEAAVDETEDKEYKPATDVQAALTVLGRREHWDTESENRYIDLSGTDLRGANMCELNFDKANFWGSHMKRANLGGTHLARAGLVDAHLEEAILWVADLTDAETLGACFTGALYSENTIFPDDLDFEAHEMEKLEDEIPGED